MVTQVRSRSVSICLSATLGVCLVAVPQAIADPPQKKLDAKTLHFLQTGQEYPEPFVPNKPRTVEDSRQLEALKHFCIGRWLENEHRWNDAIASYAKALQSDPKAIPIYKALIPLCRHVGRRADAKKYLQDAVAIGTDDYELLFQLAVLVGSEGQPDAAVGLLQRAAASPKLEKRSPEAFQIFFGLGEILEKLRKFDEAANAYVEAMKGLENPTQYRLTGPMFRTVLRNKSAQFERFGEVFLKAKRYDNALHAFQQAQATASDSTRPRFFFQVARVYLEQKKYTEALENLERYLEGQTPSGSEGYELLARVLAELGRSGEILPRLEAAAERDKFNVSLRFFLAQQYEAKGDIEKAKKTYQELMARDPDGRVYAALAAIYRREGRLPELLDVLGKAIEQALEGNRDEQILRAYAEQARALGSDAAQLEKLIEVARGVMKDDPAKLRLGAKYFVASTARQGGKLDTAIEFFQLCLRERARSPRIFLDLYSVYIAAEKPKEAAQLVRQAMDGGIWPRNSFAYSALADALDLAGQVDEAVDAARRAIEEAPDEAEGYFLKGRIYLRAGQHDKALQAYEQIVTDFSETPAAVRRARYALSNVYSEMGNMPKAESVLQDVLKESPNDSTANNDLGYIWADQGKNLEEAERMIRRALESYASERDPDDPEKNAAYLDSLGWVLFKQGRYDEARKYLEEAYAAPNGQDGTIVDHLGDAYYRLKDNARALQLWQKALELLQKSRDPRERRRVAEVQGKIKSLQEPKGKGELQRSRPDAP